MQCKPKTPKQMTMNMIRNVIFNDPATIVIWADGTKTVVKADREPFDPEKGLAMALTDDNYIKFEFDETDNNPNIVVKFKNMVTLL